MRQMITQGGGRPGVISYLHSPTHGQKKRWSFEDHLSLHIKLIALLSQIKPIQVHHLVPGSNKVLYELLLRILTSIHFCDGSEFGV